MKKLKDKSVDHAFTSPPYNRKRNDKYDDYDDSGGDWFEFMDEVIQELIRVTKKYVFFNVQKNYYNKQDVFNLIGKYSERIVEIIIWNKTNPMPASGNNITNAYEYIIVFADEPLKANGTYTKNVITTSVYSQNPYKKIHRAVMKPELATEILSNFTQKGDIILDPFMGVGTTAVTSLGLDRHYIGYELSEEYWEKSLERIEAHTAQTILF